MAEEGFAVDVPEGKLHDLFEDLAIVNSGQWLCAEETLKNSFYFSAGAYRDPLLFFARGNAGRRYLGMG